MKELGITKGPYEVCEHNWSDTSFYGNGKVICTQSIYDEATEETQEELESKVSTNFKLIEDAFNTAQKANLLPSELLERYNEAIEVLEDMHEAICKGVIRIYGDEDEINLQGLYTKIKQTISKAK